MHNAKVTGPQGRGNDNSVLHSTHCTVQHTGIVMQNAIFMCCSRFRSELKENSPDIWTWPCYVHYALLQFCHWKIESLNYWSHSELFLCLLRRATFERGWLQCSYIWRTMLQSNILQSECCAFKDMQLFKMLSHNGYIWRTIHLKCSILQCTSVSRAAALAIRRLNRWIIYPALGHSAMQCGHLWPHYLDYLFHQLWWCWLIIFMHTHKLLKIY